MSRARDILKTSFVALLVLTSTLTASFTLTPNSSFASTETEDTLMQPEGTQDMGTTTNATTSTTQTSSSANQSGIPETAIGPTIPPEKGYFVEEIGDGLYWVTDGSYNTMFLVTDEGVVAVDAPPSLERTISRQYLK